MASPVAGAPLRVWRRRPSFPLAFCVAVPEPVTPPRGSGSLVRSLTERENARRARRHQDRRPDQHHPRPLRHHAAGRPGRRRDQGRGAGRRHGAPYRQAGEDAGHGADLPLREPQQAIALPRSQEPGGARRRCSRWWPRPTPSSMRCGRRPSRDWGWATRRSARSSPTSSMSAPTATRPTVPTASCRPTTTPSRPASASPT